MGRSGNLLAVAIGIPSGTPAIVPCIPIADSLKAVCEDGRVPKTSAHFLAGDPTFGSGDIVVSTRCGSSWEIEESGEDLSRVRIAVPPKVCDPVPLVGWTKDHMKFIFLVLGLFRLNKVVLPKGFHRSPHPTEMLPVTIVRERVIVIPSVHLESDAPLLFVAHAKGLRCLGFGVAEGREKHASEDRNDGDHDEEFDQRETVTRKEGRPRITR